MRARGSALIAALMVMVVIVMMGQAFLSRRMAQSRGAEASVEAAQALALAESGLADARAKLEKDPLFPPPASDEQTLFCYAEDLLSSDGRRVGSYHVEIDSRFSGEPYRVLRLRSTGYVGPRDQPIAARTVLAELDLAPQDRDDPLRANDLLFRYVNWTQDEL